MRNPWSLHPGEPVRVVGHVFGTPLVVKGWTWLPLAQLLAWVAMVWHAGRKQPRRSFGHRVRIGVATMAALLGSEWGHNLAHVAAARAVSRPMDALRIAWGMPLCIYYDVNDPGVSPRQHIARSLGGPLFNAGMLPLAMWARKAARPESVLREAAAVAATTNTLLLSASLLPLPAIDGGPMLKWGLVDRGQSIEEADRAVRKVDGVLGIILGLGSAGAFARRRPLVGGLLGLLGAMALGYALGVIEDR